MTDKIIIKYSEHVAFDRDLTALVVCKKAGGKKFALNKFGEWIEIDNLVMPDDCIYDIRLQKWHDETARDT